ncbi:unnamed protein product, partial [Didymodactylos carnosus]
TKRRGKILNFNDHQYTKKRSNKSTDKWRCRIRSCNSIIVLVRDASTVIHPPTDHSHVPDPIQAKVDEFKNTCKTRAREETTPISQIHEQELVKCSLKHNDISFLPSYSSIDSSFYREQLKNDPKSDLLESDSRVLVFDSKWGIEYLSEVDTWHMDGTFKTRPLLFAQLYIIHDYRNGYMIPTICTLTSDKSDDQAATTFNDYITDTYVDDDALFPSFIWNVHDLIITDQP